MRPLPEFAAIKQSIIETPMSIARNAAVVGNPCLKFAE